MSVHYEWLSSDRTRPSVFYVYDVLTGSTSYGISVRLADCLKFDGLAGVFCNTFCVTRYRQTNRTSI